MFASPRLCVEYNSALTFCLSSDCIPSTTEMFAKCLQRLVTWHTNNKTPHSLLNSNETRTTPTDFFTEMAWNCVLVCFCHRVIMFHVLYGRTNYTGQTFKRLTCWFRAQHHESPDLILLFVRWSDRIAFEICLSFPVIELRTSYSEALRTIGEKCGQIWITFEPVSGIYMFLCWCVCVRSFTSTFRKPFISRISSLIRCSYWKPQVKNKKNHTNILMQFCLSFERSTYKRNVEACKQVYSAKICLDLDESHILHEILLLPICFLLGLS